MVVFKGATHYRDWYTEVKDEKHAYFTYSPKGYATDDIGLDWLKRFDAHTVLHLWSTGGAGKATAKACRVHCPVAVLADYGSTISEYVVSSVCMDVQHQARYAAVSLLDSSRQEIIAGHSLPI